MNITWLIDRLHLFVKLIEHRCFNRAVDTLGSLLREWIQNTVVIAEFAVATFCIVKIYTKRVTTSFKFGQGKVKLILTIISWQSVFSNISLHCKQKSTSQLVIVKGVLLPCYALFLVLFSSPAATGLFYFA